MSKWSHDDESQENGWRTEHGEDFRLQGYCRFKTGFLLMDLLKTSAFPTAGLGPWGSCYMHEEQMTSSKFIKH